VSDSFAPSWGASFLQRSSFLPIEDMIVGGDGWEPVIICSAMLLAPERRTLVDLCSAMLSSHAHMFYEHSHAILSLLLDEKQASFYASCEFTSFILFISYYIHLLHVCCLLNKLYIDSFYICIYGCLDPSTATQ
jgi:hypothetical protein